MLLSSSKPLVPPLRRLDALPAWVGWGMGGLLGGLLAVGLFQETDFARGGGNAGLLASVLAFLWFLVLRSGIGAVVAATLAMPQLWLSFSWTARFGFWSFIIGLVVLAFAAFLSFRRGLRAVTSLSTAILFTGLSALQLAPSLTTRATGGMISLIGIATWVVLRAEPIVKIRPALGSIGRFLKTRTPSIVPNKNLRHSFLHHSASALALAPLLFVLVYVYENRTLSLVALVYGSRGLLLLTASILGCLVLWNSGRLIGWIERQLFRERYDAHQILLLLEKRIGAIRDPLALKDLITKEIDLALCVESVSLMCADPHTGILVDLESPARRLASTSRLGQLISHASGPINVDLERPNFFSGKIDPESRKWLIDGNLGLLVPILANNGVLWGLLCLGHKRSGVSYKEDRQLLWAISKAAAWVLEIHALEKSPA